jgi:hypothetical protein
VKIPDPSDSLKNCEAYQVNRRVPDFHCMIKQGHGGPHLAKDGTRWGVGQIPRGMRYAKAGNR